MSEISRREFFKQGARVLAEIAAVGAIGGCTNLQAERPIITPPRPKVPENKPGLPPLTDEEILSASREAITNYNMVLKANLSVDSTLQNIVIVRSLAEYQEILAKVETDYVKRDESNRMAIATEETSSYGKKIFLYKTAIEYASRYLPGNQDGKMARQEHIEEIMRHELVHYSALSYRSYELYNFVFKIMLAKAFTGKDVKQENVHGAKVKASVEGKIKSVFQNLEEAEAFSISDYVMSKRAKKMVIKPVKPEDLGLEKQVTLFADLLSRLGPNKEEELRALALLRMKAGGREEFARKIGQTFKVRLEDQLYFGMRMLYAIDMGDSDFYTQMVARK